MSFRLFVVLLFTSYLAFSQTGQYKIYHLSIDDGLISNNVECLYQDSYGFLWMGSFDGLVRWDGNSFRKYVHHENDKRSISQNIVYCIFEDSKRRLWIGSIGGLDLYNRETDSFERIDIGRGDVRIPLNAIEEDKTGMFWLGTAMGLCHFNPDNRKPKWYYSSSKKDSLSDNMIFALARDKEDNLWIGTFNGGLVKYSPSTKTFNALQHQHGNPQTICSNKIRRLLIDHSGMIWAGTFDKGITQLNSQGKVLQHFRTTFGDQSDNQVTCLYEDKQHIIWACKGNELLQYFNRSDQTFVPFKNPVYKKYHMQCIGISDMFEDNFGNTWFGSHCNGLFYTNQSKNTFRHYFDNYITKNDLSNDVITCIHEQNKSSIWLGTDGGGLNLFNPQTQSFRTFTTSSGLSSNNIQDIKQDKNGKLWIATWSGGLMEMNPNTYQTTVHSHQANNKNSLIFNNIKSLALQDSLLWIGTHGQGLCVYDLVKKTFTHQENNTKYNMRMLDPTWINHLLLDSKNNLWIGTYGGLYRYDQQKMEKYQHSPDTGSLTANDINMIAEDGSGNIWIATEAGGLERYDASTNSFRHYLRPDLPSTIKALQFDNQGLLWLSGNDGLYSLNPKTNKTEHYEEPDGLQGNSFFLKSIMKDAEGNIYVGGINGFNSFNPERIKNNIKDPVFYFTDLFLFDKLQQAGIPESPISSQLAFCDELSLTHEQSFFTIHYTLIDFYAAGKTQFAYKLIGLHDEWISLGKERKISFTELPPGSYQLKVRYTQRDGSWKEVVNSLNIVIHPPWWKSWWFKILLVLLLNGVLLLVYKTRVRRIKHRNLELKKEVELRTTELSERNSDLMESNEEIRLQKEQLEEINTEVIRQSDKILKQQEFILGQNQELSTLVQKLSLSDQTKNLFFTILAHDLKGPINAIGSLSEMMLNNIAGLSQAEIAEFTQHIHKSSSSVKQLLYNLLDWARTQSQFIEYTPTPTNLYDAASRNLQLLEQQCLQKNISIENTLNKQHTLQVDPNMLDTILRNLLSNAVKYTPSGGSVRISSVISENRIEIRISDTGIGMNEKEQLEVFQLDKRQSKKGTKGESGTGLGLIIVKEFVEINQGSISIESSVNIGTTFILRLPIASEEISAVSDFQTPVIFSESSDKASELSIAQLAEVKGNRILIVEDNEAMRNHLKLLLASTFEIIEAENGEEALRIAAETQPTVVITDMVMPIMDGLQLCKTLKSDPATSHIPVVILTSHDTEESRLSGYYAGADIYLTKPVAKEMLFQVVYNILQSREVLRQKLLNDSGDIPDKLELAPLDNKLINEINAYIEMHIADQTLEVHQIVRHIGMSRSVLYSKFKAITGQGVNEFIRLVRLRKSRELLAKNEMSINEIADAVGFNSASYFIRCFVKEYGSTPGEYRERK